MKASCKYISISEPYHVIPSGAEIRREMVTFKAHLGKQLQSHFQEQCQNRKLMSENQDIHMVNLYQFAPSIPFNLRKEKKMGSVLLLTVISWRQFCHLVWILREA